MAKHVKKHKYKGIHPPEKTKKSVDHGTPELRAKRAALVGPANAARQEAGDILGVLMLRGQISDSQRAAGAVYAQLRRKVVGDPHCSIGSYGDSISGKESGGASAVDERHWNRCVIELRLVGGKREVDQAAVFNRMPESIVMLQIALTALERVT